MYKMQKTVKQLIKDGYNRERAVLVVARHFKLSLAQMELLHFSVKG
jgi:hypothetical protein